MAQEKMFGRMSLEHPLVPELASGRHPWWSRLVELSHTDPDINIQVRGSYLNVYCKMGNLLKIYMKGKKVACQVHYKYLVGAHSPEYVDALPSGDDIAVSEDGCGFVSSILDEKNFRMIKQNISTYAGEEKKIQSRLVEKNKETVLDVEIAFSDKEVLADSEDGNTRIDFVNFDQGRKCLILVELKQIFDGRLYTKEINRQILKYSAFAKKHEAALISAYNHVLQVKRKLGLITSGCLLNAVISKVESKPVLAIAGYNQDVIEGMKGRILEREKDPLDIKMLAAVYFFGIDVDLNLKNSKNKKVFI